MPYSCEITVLVCKTRVLLCLSCHCKLQQKTGAVTLLECTTISLSETPHFFTICNCCFLHNLGDRNRIIYHSSLLIHREALSLVQPLFVLIHGILPRKEQQEQARLASWSSPCAMFAQALPATLPIARAKAPTGNNPSALTQGQNQLSTLQNKASPFQSNIKCVFYHCKYPGVILHACKHLRYASKHPAAKHSSALHACQERQWFHSTDPKPSVSESSHRTWEGCSDFLYIRALCIFWKWTSPEPLKKTPTCWAYCLLLLVWRIYLFSSMLWLNMLSSHNPIVILNKLKYTFIKQKICSYKGEILLYWYNGSKKQLFYLVDLYENTTRGFKNTRQKDFASRAVIYTSH